MARILVALVAIAPFCSVVSRAGISITAMMEVDHVRFACTFSDQGAKSEIDEAKFCDAAVSALADLAIGHLDHKVATQRPWSTILDPEAAVRECASSGPPVPGRCDWNIFQLSAPEVPLSVVLVPAADALVNDPTGLTVAIRAIQVTTSRVDVSFIVVQPANHYAAQQRTIETATTIPLESGTDGQRSLHEELQVMFSRYFFPATINQIKATDIIKRRAQQSQGGKP